ncbi:MAG: type I CRISPR-associated protein Cas7 [Eubacteriales bacterium]|nr:type I CRISPR-associated protein Cas7 [Eubacteriales bacterium]MDZ7610060.1 type I CRISPR-associated protein Cas7 [Eubacteriales bacterium]
MQEEGKMLRGTGLLIIEVVNSNPNGNPDRDNDPRQRPDGTGEISPVSFKRKIRDLIENKEGPVWQEIVGQFDPPLTDEHYAVLESRDRDRSQITREINEGTFINKYWDARVFGCTFLEENLSNSIKTGVVQFGLGLSVAPVAIERMTNTNKSGVQEGKDRGMAPLAYRIIQHGVYSLPFFINPTAAVKSACTKQDIALLLKLIPYAYPHTASYLRPFVNVRHAWYVEHMSPLGSFSDFQLITALTPKKKGDPSHPSRIWEDYEVPAGLPKELKNKVHSFKDLMSW